MAVQRLPARAQRVPAATPQTPQVPLPCHVTKPGRQNHLWGRAKEDNDKRKERIPVHIDVWEN